MRFPTKTETGLFALGGGFLGVVGIALWSYMERRRRYTEARVTALMESKDDSEAKGGVYILSDEDKHVENLMSTKVVDESNDLAKTISSESGSGSNSPI